MQPSFYIVEIRAVKRGPAGHLLVGKRIDTRVVTAGEVPAARDLAEALAPRTAVLIGGEIYAARLDDGIVVKQGRLPTRSRALFDPVAGSMLLWFALEREDCCDDELRRRLKQWARGRVKRAASSLLANVRDNEPSSDLGEALDDLATAELRRRTLALLPEDDTATKATRRALDRAVARKMKHVRSRIAMLASGRLGLPDSCGEYPANTTWLREPNEFELALERVNSLHNGLRSHLRWLVAKAPIHLRGNIRHVLWTFSLLHEDGWRGAISFNDLALMAHVRRYCGHRMTKSETALVADYLESASSLFERRGNGWMVALDVWGDPRGAPLDGDERQWRLVEPDGVALLDSGRRDEELVAAQSAHEAAQASGDKDSIRATRAEVRDARRRMRPFVESLRAERRRAEQERQLIKTLRTDLKRAQDECRKQRERADKLESRRPPLHETEVQRQRADHLASELDSRLEAQRQERIQNLKYKIIEELRRRRAYDTRVCTLQELASHFEEEVHVIREATSRLMDDSSIIGFYDIYYSYPRSVIGGRYPKRHANRKRGKSQKESRDSDLFELISCSSGERIDLPTHSRRRENAPRLASRGAQSSSP